MSYDPKFIEFMKKLGLNPNTELELEPLPPKSSPEFCNLLASFIQATPGMSCSEDNEGCGGCGSCSSDDVDVEHGCDYGNQSDVATLTVSCGGPSSIEFVELLRDFIEDVSATFRANSRHFVSTVSITTCEDVGQEPEVTKK
jgi:hypothetical protein